MSAGALASLLWLVLLGPCGLRPRADAGCADEGRCCPGRDRTCASSGWRADRVYGTCFCDEACRLSGDCCHDYPRTCPALRCIVGEWSHWSGCAEQCKPSMRMRKRYVKQEPKNGGESCPPLEEKSGCLEYLTYQRQDCGHEHGPLPGCPVGLGTCPAGVNNTQRGCWNVVVFFSHAHCGSGLAVAVTCNKGSGVYCVEFKTESLSHHCTVENRPYARWMQYLREGYIVCVACQPPAMNTGNQRCSGDGLGANGNKVLHWQAVGNPQCQGTWKKVQQMEQCSCPVVHSFIFT